MQIETSTVHSRTVMKLTGRLDVTWAEHVLTGAQDLIRSGQHELRVDASGLEYLSSAGIRVLIRIARDLKAVNGSLAVIHPSSFVENTLRMSGLGQLLAEEEPGTEAERPPPAEPPRAGPHIDVYPLQAGAAMDLRVPAAWQPWDPLRDTDIVRVPFPAQTVGLGIGSQGVDAADSRQRLGEFVAVPGGVIWLPPGGGGTPDYLLQTENLVPEIFAVQALVAQGNFSHLFRFQPRDNGDVMTLSALINQAMRVTEADAVVMLCLAEVDGLVGAALSRSPGLIGAEDTPAQFPDIRDWIAFCGDRVHARQSVLLVSFAAKESATPRLPLLAPLPSLPGVSAHTHAAVYPFRPLQAGGIDMDPAVRLCLEDVEPMDLLHLIEDDRPAVGLGQSALIRGACWCAPLVGGKEDGL